MRDDVNIEGRKSQPEGGEAVRPDRFRSLCVFAGSRIGCDPTHRDAAEALGILLAKRRIRLIYGGGAIGLMGVTARAVLDHGGEVTGIIPDFLMSLEVGDPGVTELVVVDSMHARKALMFERADGFVVLPGGLGTIDETVEIATWKQLQLHPKPIVVVNTSGYWDKLRSLFSEVVQSGYAHQGISRLLTFVESVEDVFPALAGAPPLDREVLTSHL